MTTPTNMLKAAVLVVSTTAAKDPSTDAAVATLREVFDADGDGKWSVVDTKIVSDNNDDIQSQILEWTDESIRGSSELGPPVHLIVTTGGTGFAISDVTPEAVAGLLEKPAPGLVYGMLAASMRVTPFAVMARPVAGVRKKSIIVTLPGSPKGAKENLQAIIKMLPHACMLAAGIDSRSLHAGGIQKLEREAGTASQGHAHRNDHSHNHSHSHSHGHGHGHGLVRHGQPDSAASLLSNDPSLGPSRRSRASPFPMIDVDEALARIEQYTPQLDAIMQLVNEDLVGCVVAEDVFAQEDVPAFRASIVDGYAIVVPPSAGTSDVSGIFPVVAVSHATAPQGETVETLQPNGIARITTGAPLPPGANAVVMVENTMLRETKTDESNETDAKEEERLVEIQATGVRPGDNVREVGSDMQKGELLLQSGTLITAAGGEVGLLASVGVKTVLVYRRPVVGVLSTGDEIVQANRELPLRLGEVRDTNRPTLLAAARAFGFPVADLGIARDEAETLEQRLRSVLRSVDVLITTGGVSMGELDLLKPTIERALGGTIHFGRVAMKPGKPTTFATVEIKESALGQRVTKTIFSLPGNPASALVTFHLFVLPALHKLAHHPSRGLPRLSVVLGHDFGLDRDRPEYHRAVVRVGPGNDGTLVATSTGRQRSSMVRSMRSANALLCMPAGSEPLHKGDRVDALLMSNVLSAERTD